MTTSVIKSGYAIRFLDDDTGELSVMRGLQTLNTANAVFLDIVAQCNALKRNVTLELIDVAKGEEVLSRTSVVN